MNSESASPAGGANDTVWQSDERWLLVQRIAASQGFQRAGQIRRILEHITRATIQNPGVVLREYEIACDVLGRRASFDPANDNIVRQQMSQLRRRLEQYYLEEGRHESLRLTIPKGSYAPHFAAIALPEGGPTLAAEGDAVPSGPHDLVVQSRGILLPVPLLAGLLAMLVALPLGVWLLRDSPQQRVATTASTPGSANAFVEYLARANGRVTIVQPDLSLVMVQNALGLDVSPQDYSRPNFLKDKIDAIADSRERFLLTQLSIRRLTSTEEAATCSDLQDELIARGKPTAIRFARDLRTRDLGDGNLILIGSRRSNPWTLLFTQQNSFQFERRTGELFQFVNMQPQPGEQKVYVPYERHEGNIASYVDVVFGPNLTKSGYVVVINGSDAVVNVAAARFLFRGKLRPDIVNLLRKPDLSRFELFLRGSHAENEAEDSFELIAVRSSTN